MINIVLNKKQSLVILKNIDEGSSEGSKIIAIFLIFFKILTIFDTQVINIVRKKKFKKGCKIIEKILL